MATVHSKSKNGQSGHLHYDITAVLFGLAVYTHICHTTWRPQGLICLDQNSFLFSYVTRCVNIQWYVHVPATANQVRPDLLNVLLFQPGGSKFSRFQKLDHMIELMCTYTWLRHRWLVCGSMWKSFQAALCYSGPESLTVPRTWQFIVKIRGGQVGGSGWSCDFFFFFFFAPATQVYFVNELKQQNIK